MNENFEESDADSPDSRASQQDYHRRTMAEVRVAVTRGAAGIQASYFFDQETHDLEDETP
jgi:hypothetical protein